jgi:uncharacterized protein
MDLYIPITLFFVAFLYSAVGHGGASGYTAVLALFGMAAPSLKPAILIMNIAVSLIGFARFSIAKQVNFKLLLPLLVLSIPCAYLGGTIHISRELLEKLIGFALLLSAVSTFVFDGILTKQNAQEDVNPPKLPIIGAIGAGFGFLAGLTGIGGGVFLSPLMLHLKWAKIREISGISAGFILFNSLSGLLGQMQKTIILPPNFHYWIIAVVLGGFLGSWLGLKKLGIRGLKVWLSLIVFSAALKLLT